MHTHGTGYYTHYTGIVGRDSLCPTKTKRSCPVHGHYRTFWRVNSLFDMFHCVHRNNILCRKTSVHTCRSIVIFKRKRKVYYNNTH